MNYSQFRQAAHYVKLLFAGLFLSHSIFVTMACAGPLNSTETRPIASAARWTYIRIVDYNDLWGTDGPDLTAVLEHLPSSVPDGMNFVLFGEGYRNTGSVYAYVNSGGKRTLFLPQQSMSRLDTYSKFFEWVSFNFPAQQFILSYWGHGYGSGYPKGTLGFDANTSAGLSVNAFGDLVRDLSGRVKKKLSLVFLCTCVNGTIENAYAIRDYAEYLVAGESTVGCALEPMKVLERAQNLTAAELADKTIAGFDGSLISDDVVYASVRLDRIPILAKLISRLAENLNRFISGDSQNRGKIMNIASKSQNMNPMSSPSWYGTYLDLADFVGTLSSDLPGTSLSRDASAVREELMSRVITSSIRFSVTGKYSRAQGLSIVHPTDSCSRVDLDYYKSHSFSKDSGWADYLQNLMAFHSP